MAEQKLMGEHRQFIINQRAQFVLNNTEICNRLLDPKYGQEYGFKPVKVHNSRISQLVNQEKTQEEIQKRRLAWLSDFDDTPLAHKKPRVLELVKLYNKTETDDYATYGTSGITNTGAFARRRVQLDILRQIKDEIGEDIDKLADALKAPVHIIYEQRIKMLGEGLRAFNFALPDGNGFKPSTN